MGIITPVSRRLEWALLPQRQVLLQVSVQERELLQEHIWLPLPAADMTHVHLRPFTPTHLHSTAKRLLNGTHLGCRPSRWTLLGRSAMIRLSSRLLIPHSAWLGILRLSPLRLFRRCNSTSFTPSRPCPLQTGMAACMRLRLCLPALQQLGMHKQAADGRTSSSRSRQVLRQQCRKEEPTLLRRTALVRQSLLLSARAAARRLWDAHRRTRPRRAILIRVMRILPATWRRQQQPPRQPQLRGTGNAKHVHALIRLVQDLRRDSSNAVASLVATVLNSSNSSRAADQAASMRMILRTSPGCARRATQVPNRALVSILTILPESPSRVSPWWMSR